MSVFRSYFSKSATLIEDNRTNNSQNPVTEISYGTLNAIVSRYIFELDLEPLKQRILNGEINPNTIQKHVLYLTNTIRYRPDEIGKKFPDCETRRAASFDLELFNVTQSWDEGNGYDFVYIDEQFPQLPQQAVNWFDRKTNVAWEEAGAFITGGTGTSEILGSQHFEDGSENLEIDITDYVNSMLFTGSTGFTGSSFGLGLKFPASIEALELLDRYAVGFFTNKTNTFFEPFVETTVDNEIIDDRNYFFLDKDNELYLYTNVGNKAENVTVTGVTIIDYEGNPVVTLTGDSITNVKRGVYKITVNISSDAYPDAVLFTDRWSVVQNGVPKTVDKEFYLISQDNYFDYSLDNRINFDNYLFNIVGINEREKIKRGEKRRVFIDVRSLYPNQESNIALDIQYRIYITQSDKFEVDVIPFTSVDRTEKGYEFLLDTSWFIEQDYYLEINVIDDNIKYSREPFKFSIID